MIPKFRMQDNRLRSLLTFSSPYNFYPTNLPTMETDTPQASKAQANGALTVRDARTSLYSKQEQQQRKRQKLANRDYGRGKAVDVRNVRDKKLRTNMKKLETKYKTAINQAKDAEILLENTAGFIEAETDLERTYRVRQDEITAEATVEAAQKRFDLKLDELGPYQCEFTRNGRELLLAGRKGHVATMDFREGKLGCELQLGETIRGTASYTVKAKSRMFADMI